MRTARKRLTAEIFALLQKNKHAVILRVREMNKADDDDDGVDMDDLGRIAGSYIENTAKESGAITLQQLRITDEGLVDQVFVRAVRYARARSAELVTGVSETTKEGIRRIIARGLEENIGTDAVIDLLEHSYEFSHQRAKTIAETEIGNANGFGSLEGLEAGEAVGLTVLKEWYPDPEACPICLDNAAVGAIPLDEAFPSGDMAPLAHPNCECSLLGVVGE